VALAIAAGLVVVTFWVALDPVVEEARDCSTNLLPSAFKSALVPVHLLALAIVSAAVWSLGAARSAAMRPGRPTIAALAAVWVYVAACLFAPDLFGIAALVGVFGGPTVGLAALLVLAVRALMTAHSTSLPPEDRWRDYASTTLALGWGALLLGIPASLSYAWLRGADPFCF
jgi:hypothetical protein